MAHILWDRNSKFSDPDDRFCRKEAHLKQIFDEGHWLVPITDLAENRTHVAHAYLTTPEKDHKIGSDVLC